MTEEQDRQLLNEAVGSVRSDEEAKKGIADLIRFHAALQDCTQAKLMLMTFLAMMGTTAPEMLKDPIAIVDKSVLMGITIGYKFRQLEEQAELVEKLHG